MATIVNHGVVCDGYDATALLSNGERLTFHWPAGVEPVNVQAGADAMEAAHLAVLAEQDTWEVVGEQL